MAFFAVKALHEPLIRPLPAGWWTSQCILNVMICHDCHETSYMFLETVTVPNWMSRSTKAWLFAREELQRILRAVFILSCCQGFVCNAMSRTWQTPWSFLTNNFQKTTVCIASFHPALSLVLSQFLAASLSLACKPGHWCLPWRRTRSSGESVAKGKGGGSTKRTYCCLTILFRLFHFVWAAFYTYYLIFANTCAALEIHTHALSFSPRTHRYRTCILEYRCLPMTPYALTRSYKYPSDAIWICQIAARVPFLAVVRGCTGWCVGKPGEHKGRNQRNWYTPFAARLEGGCTSCATCFRGIATGQMAHLAELPKPGRVESFKCWIS